MKYDNLKAFQKHLTSAAPLHLASAYLIMSDDQFLSKDALHALKEHFKGAEIIAQESGIAEELSSMTLFQKKKLVIALEVESLSKKEQELVTEWIKKPGRDSYLVLVTPKLKKTTALYKAIEKYGVVLETPEVKPWAKEKETLAWLREQKPIDERAASLLIEFVGTDKMALHSELEKLSLYAGSRITSPDVLSLCKAIPKENLFKLSESIFTRDGKKASRQFVSLHHEGVQPLALIRLLRQQFETDLQVAILCKQGSEGDIGELFPYMKGFILEQHKKQALSYGISSFKKGLIAIDKAEYRIKSISVDPEILLSTLIAELCIN